MTRTRVLTALAATLPFLIPGIAAADDPQMSTFRGEVVEVQLGAPGEGASSYDHVRIRTRDGRELRLRLGKAGSCGDCFREGDRIRVRARRSAGGEPWLVDRTKVRRHHSMYQYAFQNGDLVRDRTRLQLRDGTGAGSGEQREQKHRHRARETEQTRKGGTSQRSANGGGGTGNGG